MQCSAAVLWKTKALPSRSSYSVFHLMHYPCCSCCSWQSNFSKMRCQNRSKWEERAFKTALLLQTTSLRTALENHMAWISRGSVRQRFPMQTKWWSFWILLRTQRLQSVCAALLTPNNQKGEKCRSHHNGDCTFAGLSQWCFSSARPATILEAPVVPKAQLSTTKATLATSTFGSAKGI